MPECFWPWEANTRQMVLDRHDAQGARSGDVDFIEAWLQNLDSPEDINEVDAKGRTVLNLCAL